MGRIDCSKEVGKQECKSHKLCAVAKLLVVMGLIVNTPHRAAFRNQKVMM